MKWRARGFKQRLATLERKVAKQKAKAKQSPPVLVTASPQEMAFLEAIAAEPQEVAHRMAFTDWLEETVERSLLRDTVMEFHRDWVRLRRTPKEEHFPRRRGHTIRYFWMRDDCLSDWWTQERLDLFLFDCLTKGSLWDSSKGIRRAYKSPALAEVDLLLAYLRRVNLQPVKEEYAVDY